jgi:hypothetical protein
MAGSAASSTARQSLGTTAGWTTNAATAGSGWLAGAASHPSAVPHSATAACAAGGVARAAVPASGCPAATADESLGAATGHAARAATTGRRWLAGPACLSSTRHTATGNSTAGDAATNGRAPAAGGSPAARVRATARGLAGRSAAAGTLDRTADGAAGRAAGPRLLARNAATKSAAAAPSRPRRRSAGTTRGSFRPHGISIASRRRKAPGGAATRFATRASGRAAGRISRCKAAAGAADNSTATFDGPAGRPAAGQ